MFKDYAYLLGLIASIIGILGGIIEVLKWIRTHARTWASPKARRSKAPLRHPITYSILAINLFITGLLPLQLCQEFPLVSTESAGYAPYTFYFRHYPHIVIFPVLFFGFAALFIFRALHIWGQCAIAKANWRIAFASVLALVVAFWEMRGRQMMLFEFNPEAQSVTEPFSRDDIVQKAKSVGLPHAVDPASPPGRQVMAAVNNGLTPPPKRRPSAWMSCSTITRRGINWAWNGDRTADTST